MMDDKEITIYEVWRAIIRMETRLSEMHQSVISRPEYEADQERAELDRNRQERDHREWKEESTKEHARLDSKMDTLKTNLTSKIEGVTTTVKETEEGEKTRKVTVWVAIIMGGSGLITGLVNAIISLGQIP